MVNNNNNSKCRLCGDRDEMINYVSGCNQLAQKEYKTWRNWLGKMIHWKFCERLKFFQTAKCGMHKLKS